MPEPEKKENFWTTLPGILTGVAALLTAFTGFWIATSPHGGVPKAEPAAAASMVEPPAKAAVPVRSSAPPQAASSQPPPAVEHTSVVVTSRKNEITQVSASSFHHNLTSEGIQLSSGQTIAFDRIKAIDFLDVDGDAHLVGVRVLLTNGNTKEDSLATSYAFNGQSDLGPFTIFVQDVKQLQFN
ncbi:MAG TPA: hypothetical protein VIM60_05600 [Edaphobacter sp.]